MTKPKIENRLWIRVPIEFVPILDRLAREQWTSKEQVARAFIVEGVRRQLEAQGLDGASPRRNAGIMSNPMSNPRLPRNPARRAAALKRRQAVEDAALAALEANATA
jgi:hypothetical protein